MNRLHRWYCRSSHWKKTLENEVLPEVLSGVNLGDEVLELGPGPGLATDWLQQLCNQLTCIEVDSKLAGALRARRTNTNVTVDCGDATAMPYIDRSFSSVVSLTMLHHIPSPILQDRLFAEVHRVLRPGGVFVGADSMGSLLMSMFHFRDTMILVDPATLAGRLAAAGFTSVRIQVDRQRYSFHALRRTDTMVKKIGS
jgi:SAM-dependent methyltransferase